MVGVSGQLTIRERTKRRDLILTRTRGDMRRVELWAWCPAVPFAAVNDAPVDTLGALLTVATLGAAAGARRGALLLGYLPGSRGGGTDDDEPEHFPGQSVRCGRAGFMRCVAR